MTKQFTEFDEKDKQITRILSKTAEITNALLGEMVDLSTSATNERVRKLKESGIIKKIVAFIDSSFMDMSLCAFVYVVINHPTHNTSFLETVLKHPLVMECHHMTGAYSYLLKVRVSDTKELEKFISDFLKRQTGVVNTKTEIILSSLKEEAVIVD